MEVLMRHYLNVMVGSGNIVWEKGSMICKKKSRGIFYIIEM